MRKISSIKQLISTVHNLWQRKKTNLETERPPVKKDKDSIPKPSRSRSSRGKQSNRAKSANHKLSRKVNSKALISVEANTTYIRNLKGKRPIVALTAYDSIMGSALSELMLTLF